MLTVFVQVKACVGTVFFFFKRTVFFFFFLKLQPSIAIPQDQKQRIYTFLTLKGYLCKGDYNVVIIVIWQIKLQCLS